MYVNFRHINFFCSEARLTKMHASLYATLCAGTSHRKSVNGLFYPSMLFSKARGYGSTEKPIVACQQLMRVHQVF